MVDQNREGEARAGQEVWQLRSWSPKVTGNVNKMHCADFPKFLAERQLKFLALPATTTATITTTTRTSTTTKTTTTKSKTPTRSAVT